MPTYPTRLPVESTPVNPNTNVCAPTLKGVFAGTFCITPEPVRPVLSDSIIRMMPDEVRTAVYLFVAPPLNSVSVPRLLLLLLLSFGLGRYEPEVIVYCVGTPA